MIFRGRAGDAEESWKYECIGDDYKSENVKKENDSLEEEKLVDFSSLHFYVNFIFLI